MIRYLGIAMICVACVACAACGRRTDIEDATFPPPTDMLELTLDLEVGADDSPGAVLFNTPGAVDVDAAGFMYVTDWLDNVVWVVDPNGKLVTTLGAPGEGPGEFRGTPGRTFVRGDSALVLSGDGISIFHRRTGEYVDHVDLPGAHNFGQIVERDGFNWTVSLPGSIARLSVLSGKVIAETSLAPQPWLSVENGTPALSDALPRTLCTSVSQGIFCGSSADGALTVYSQALDSIRAVRVPFEPKRISRADRERIASSGGRNRLDVPSHWPAYEDLVGDDQGRLWFKLRYDPRDGVTRYWIVDPESGTTTAAGTPGNMSILWQVRAGMLYGIETYADGRRTVVRYRVSSPEHQNTRTPEHENTRTRNK